MMPFPRKYTKKQIMNLSNEYQNQDKDLRTFCRERGLKYTTIYRRFKRLSKKLQPAEDVVATTVQEEIANEARTTTKQYITLGKAVWSAYFQWAAQKGMSLEQIKKIPIHEAVIRALEKEPEYDKLVEENLELKAALQLYAQEADPVFRLKEACKLMANFLKAVTIAEALGFDSEEAGLISYYGKLLKSYLRGENEEEPSTKKPEEGEDKILREAMESRRKQQQPLSLTEAYLIRAMMREDRLERQQQVMRSSSGNSSPEVKALQQQVEALSKQVSTLTAHTNILYKST